jgi:hypothetical protein
MINRLPKEYVPDGPRASRKITTAAAAPKQPLRDRFLNSAADSVGAHPIASLGLAFLTGIILGRLVKR